ncbi:hypothetical protein [Halopseudomonas sp.]|uniref:hypothetical protein n=1 Tax=Halopseudomonas sp. TaxID=2901191 RepID=UPI00311E42BD
MKRIFPLLLVLILAPLCYASVSNALLDKPEALGFFAFYDLSYAHYLFFYYLRDEVAWGATAFSLGLLCFWSYLIIRPAKFSALSWATCIYALCMLAINGLVFTASVAYVRNWKKLPDSFVEFFAVFAELPLGWMVFLAFALIGIPLLLIIFSWLHHRCLSRDSQA